MKTEYKPASITIQLHAGRLDLALARKITELAEENGFSLYLSNSQNIRIMNIPATAVAAIKEELRPFGVQFRKSGTFPVPRTCVGKPHCERARTDTMKLSQKITSAFAKRTQVKGKFKIAISGCGFCCSGAKTTDIGIIAVTNGFDIYVGGKGGHTPQAGRRIKKKISEKEVLETIETIVAFHDEKTVTKQRLAKLAARPDFPFSEI